MRFSVHHETAYRYSAPVRLGDHLLRLTPLPEGVRALSQEIEISPGPAWQQEDLDPNGTPLTRFGFTGETAELRIISRFTCETRLPPPLPAPLPPLPWALAGQDTWLGTGEDPAVTTFAKGLATDTGHDAAAFLDLLNRTLYDRTRRHIRPEGHARTAAETLALASGACRDLTVLFMAAARSLGIPARFASGYQARSESLDNRRHMHAWPEVFLPGAGWRGYDPTHGTPVTDTHVAVAAAPDQAATMPVEGGFWGDGVTSTLSYHIEIAAG